MFTSFDETCMRRALELAYQARDVGEVPIGAVLVLGEAIIAEGYNQSIQDSDPTAHAEIIALRTAAKNMGNYRLLNSTLYTTLEPCCMCAGAIVHARVKRIVFATPDPRAGAGGSVFNLLKSDRLNHVCEIDHGLFAEESRHLLQTFFRARRLK